MVAQTLLLLGTYKEYCLKLIFGIILFILSLHLYAQAPKVQGVNAGTGVYSANIKLPNKTATKINGITSLLETGNNDRLENSGFEHATAHTGWNVSTTGTATVSQGVDIATPIEGLKSGTISCSGNGSGGTCTIYQDAVTSHPLPGYVAGKIKTDTVSGVKFYSRINGSNYQSIDVTFITPFPYLLSTVFGSSSTGVAVEITVSASQTINITLDDMKVSSGDLRFLSNQCNDVSCTETLSANVAGTTGAISKENVEWITVSSATVSSPTFTIPVPTGIFTQVPNCTTGPQSSVREVYFKPSLSTATSLVFEQYGGTGTAAADSAFVINCQKQGVDFTNAQKAKFGYVTSSSNTDTGWSSCGHTTASFTGMGTVTNIETQCKRDRGDLLMKGKFTHGAGTATEARLALTWNGSAIVSKGTSAIPSLQMAGHWGRSGASAEYDVLLIEPSVGYVTFSKANASNGTLTKQQGTGTAGNGESISILARIPIEGWDDTNYIVGTFKDVVTSIGSNKADIQTVYFGSGANCATACSTGTCTICRQKGTKITSVTFVSTATYDVNGIDGTKYECSGTAFTGGNYGNLIQDLGASTTTKARILSGNGASSNNAGYAQLTCIGTP